MGQQKRSRKRRSASLSPLRSLLSYFLAKTLEYRACYTVVILSLHCRYTVVTLLLHCCYTAVTLLLHCFHTAFTLLLHYFAPFLVLGGDSRLPCLRVGGTRGVARHIRISIKRGAFFGTVVVQWFQSGVTVVLLPPALSSLRCSLRWCYSGVTVVLQWCHSGVIVVLLPRALPSLRCSVRCYTRPSVTTRM
jgi:hypothetical protein